MLHDSYLFYIYMLLLFFLLPFLFLSVLFITFTTLSFYFFDELYEKPTVKKLLDGIKTLPNVKEGVQDERKKS